MNRPRKRKPAIRPTIPTYDTITTNGDSLVNNVSLREQLINRVEVLDKVKTLLLIPEMECMTIKQVADFYEAEQNTVKQVALNHSDELVSDGMCYKTPVDFKILKGKSCTFKKMEQKNGKLIVQIDDKTTLEIPNRGIRCFPRRAILRMGMLLRDSKVAEEVRTQLLNIEEQTSAETKIAELTKEEGYITDIVTNLLHNNPDKVLVSLTDYHNYITRKITAIQENNKQLSNKIENDKPLVEFANQVKEADNVITIDEMCRLMHDENMDMGRIKFYKWLRIKGYLMKNNLPYQKYINNGYFKVIEYLYPTAYNIKTGTKTMITGKGQVAIMEVLRKEYPKMRK